MLTQVMRGLEFAHSRDICHKNLTPENIFIAGDNHFKLDCFSSSIKKGYGEYKPPEFWLKESVKKPGDIWAVGCILQEMMSG